jgi:hypothetical protein
VPRYLSPGWLSAAQAAIDASDVPHRESDGRRLVVQHVVTGRPEGDLTYHVRVDADGIAVAGGATDDATVVFTEDYETAARIVRGELSAQGAFMTGRIRVHGDLSELVEHSATFAEIDDVLAGLRSQTSY